MSDTSRLTPKSSSLTGWRAPQNIRWSLRNFSILPSMMVPRGETNYQLKVQQQERYPQFIDKCDNLAPWLKKSFGKIYKEIS